MKQPFPSNDRFPERFDCFSAGLDLYNVGTLSQKDYRISMVRGYLKISIFGRNQGETKNQLAGILKSVEDLRRGTYADIGRKDFLK